MPKEIERRFLIDPKYTFEGFWFHYNKNHCHIVQGYLSCKTPSIRIRISTSPKRQEARLTLKSKNSGIIRFEYEYEIPVSDAEEMLQMYCGHRRVEKTRISVKLNGLVWEIDFFHGNNSGLAIAEVELDRPDQEVDIPEWILKEITQESKYTNHHLAIMNEKLWKNSSNKLPQL
jgi:adenylate cyclase